MRTLFFSHRGVPVADDLAELTARRLKDENIHVSTANVVHALQCLVRELFFTEDDVQIFFLDKDSNYRYIPINKYGVLNNNEQYPEGFLTHEENWMFRMLKKG